MADANTPQPSFVPQTSQTEIAPRREHIGIWTVLGVVILLVAIGAWGALVFFNTDLERQVAEQEAINKEKSENQAEKVQAVEAFAELDSRIELAKELLEDHREILPVFDFISDITLTDSVRFSNFTYAPGEGNTASVDLNGAARDFNALAYQRQLFKEHESVSDLSIGSLSINPENSDQVSFTLSFTLEGTFLSYLDVPTEEKDAEEIFESFGSGTVE